jgi:hypothetical protein
VLTVRLGWHEPFAPSLHRSGYEAVTSPSWDAPEPVLHQTSRASDLLLPRQDVGDTDGARDGDLNPKTSVYVGAAGPVLVRDQYRCPIESPHRRERAALSSPTARRRCAPTCPCDRTASADTLADSVPFAVALATTDVDDLAALLNHLLAHGDGNVRWFRGQGCNSRSLSPSLTRRIDPYTAKGMIEAELRLITRFRQRSLPFWPEGYPQSDWEQLFAMQHFGVPTRLLDWSESATAAAFFAADHETDRCDCSVGDCKPTVWALDPIQLNRCNSRLDGYGDELTVLATSDDAIDSWAPGTEETRFAPWPVALYGTHNSARIVAQQGTFTVSGKEAKPLNHAPAVTSNDGVLEKITLQCSHEELMRSLRVVGVTRAAVYPELASLASDITTMEFAP